MASTNYHRIPPMPEGLEGLIELGLDLRWSWSHAAAALWRQINDDLWRATRNPWLILQTVGRKRIAELGSDPTLRTLVRMMVEDHRRAMKAPAWFDHEYGESGLSVAYFSMEYGLSEALRIYSGGLGILSGDHLKTSSDLGIPLVGVGLLYQRGYFRQSLDSNGAQIEFYPYNDPSQLPITPLRDGDEEWMTVSVEFPGRLVRFRAWEVTVGRVKLYLLDSNDPLNSPADRGITSELYGGGQEVRLQQEIALGIGGWRLLRSLDKEAEVCHLNEGHAAFAILERCRTFMKDHDVNFDVALAATRPGNIFTTHTPVEAGFDHYPPELIHKYLGEYVSLLGIDVDRVLALGRQNAQNQTEPLNMAYLAIRGSGAINGVSKLHGEVSRRIFLPLFNRWPQRDVPVSYVTNGIHVPSWDSVEADELWSDACGDDIWNGTLEGIDEKIRELPDEKLWKFRCSQRRKLVEYARVRLKKQLQITGFLREEFESNGDILDPEALTIGFARRFATYKRPTLLLHNPERLVKILNNAERPVQIIVAGKAHPADEGGKAMVQRWNDFIRRSDVRGKVIFLADYDMTLGEHMVQGVDVWLNNPRRPWEASGTSGMKVVVNGGLNLSELDGWWAEAYQPGAGWALGDGNEHSDQAWDAVEAEQLYRLLEEEIVPAFYGRDEDDIPPGWVKMMRESMAVLTPQFSTNRMLREYVEQLYLPAVQAFRLRLAKGTERAKQFVQWRENLDATWGTMKIGDVSFEKKDANWEVSTPIFFGDIAADSVEVQLYARQLDAPREVHSMKRGDKLSWEENGFLYSVTIPAKRPQEDYTVRIVPFFDGARVPLEAQHILWQAK